jgi:hypothetical protein
MLSKKYWPVKSALGNETIPSVDAAPPNFVVEELASLLPVIVLAPITEADSVPDVSFVAGISGMSAASSDRAPVMWPWASKDTLALEPAVTALLWLSVPSV